jgi:predicted metal-dependent peptidase
MRAEGVSGLAAARLWAAAKFPYLASGVFGAQVVAAPGTGTISADENWRLRADPALTAEWTAAQFGSVLIHHVCHLLRTHGERARGTGVRPDEARAWVRAADAEINDDLVPAGLDLPGHPVLPHHLGSEPGLLAEQYFIPARPAANSPGTSTGTSTGPDSGASTGPDSGTSTGTDTAVKAPRAPGNAPAPGIPAPGHDWEIDCGSAADGFGRDSDEPGSAAFSGGLSPWQAELLRRLVAQEMIRYGKEAGNVPAGLLRWAEAILTPQVDWRKLLAAELRRAVADTAGAVDYSYRRPSRRAAAVSGVVLPALRRPVPEVAVVCDTSGSMTEDLLAMVLAEVEGLLRALGLARQLRVLACDVAVAPARRVTSARQVELVGGGGTDMGAGIAAASTLRPRPAVTVVLTDGYTPWPARPPKGMRVVIGLLGDHAPDAPAWARAIRVPASRQLSPVSGSMRVVTEPDLIWHAPTGGPGQGHVMTTAKMPRSASSRSCLAGDPLLVQRPIREAPPGCRDRTRRGRRLSEGKGCQTLAKDVEPLR